MAKKYLDDSGLLYFWQQIKTKFATTAFNTFRVGTTNITADNTSDTLELVAGTNITLTPDATNDTITIESAGSTYTGTSPIDVTGSVISHEVSGATAGTYGSNSAQSPSFGGTATVPYVTIDDKGHTTGAGTANVTIPNATADGSSAGLMSSADYTKLSGIQTGAEANVQADWDETDTSSDAYIQNKPTIPPGVVVDSQLSTTSENPVQNKVITGALGDKVDTSSVGSASGVAPLNSSGIIDNQYLPSYVDDVIEAYPISGATELSAGWLSLTSGGSALTPETGKIYIILAASTSYAVNTQFRWSGSTYVELSDGNISSITNAEIDAILAS